MVKSKTIAKGAEVFVVYANALSIGNKWTELKVRTHKNDVRALRKHGQNLGRGMTRQSRKCFPLSKGTGRW